MQAHGDALAQLQAAHAIYTASLPAGHPLLAATLCACARSAAAAGDASDAERRYAAALDAARAAHGAGSFEEAVLLVEWGSCGGARDSAHERAIRRGLQLLALVLHQHHPFIVRTAALLVDEMRAAGKRTEAELVRSQFGLMRC